MIAELLLEAVENSVEAGAGTVTLEARLEEGWWYCRVSDDGHWDPGVVPFSGASSKGPGRGRGLGKIRKASRECDLVKDGGTLLTFTCADDHSLDDFFSASLPLLLWPAHVRLVWKRDGKEKVFDSEDLKAREAFPQDASGLTRFREMAGSREA